MSGDELDGRIRALEAERVRPDAQPASVEELLTRLISTLHAAFTDPPDHGYGNDEAGRLARFGNLRDHDFTAVEAGKEMRLDPRTRDRYERRRKAGKGAA